jgi:hypothetical protein
MVVRDRCSLTGLAKSDPVGHEVSIHLCNGIAAARGTRRPASPRPHRSHARCGRANAQAHMPYTGVLGRADAPGDLQFPSGLSYRRRSLRRRRSVRGQEAGNLSCWAIGDDTFVPLPVIVGCLYDVSREPRLPGGVRRRFRARRNRMIRISRSYCARRRATTDRGPPPVLILNETATEC